MWDGIDKKTKELFTSEDTVFHYTSVYTALEHILDKQQLRLSPRKHSNDPIENTRQYITNTRSYAHTKVDHDKLRENQDRVIGGMDLFSKKIHEDSKQLCFCMNKTEEDLGFLKPRMWDQYANNYKGVALAFSLEELQKSKVGIYSLSHDEVKYRDYSTLKKIDSLDFKNFTKSKNKEYRKQINDNMFIKHVDYINENEYRFLHLSKDNFNYINIENAIKGIVISQNYTSNFAIKSLEKFAKDYDIEILYINWNSDGITLLDLK